MRRYWYLWVVVFLIVISLTTYIIKERNYNQNFDQTVVLEKPDTMLYGWEKTNWEEVKGAKVSGKTISGEVTTLGAYMAGAPKASETVAE